MINSTTHTFTFAAGLADGAAGVAAAGLRRRAGFAGGESTRLLG